MRWVVALGVVAAAVMLPSEAYAWGPFTHLLCARTVLEGSGLLPPGLAELLTTFASDFYYGNVAADIVVGKNLANYVRHAHNWKNVFRLLRAAETPGQRAFAMGYLTHLAADTVAHNYYIPYKLVESFPASFLRHTYWEMRFDQPSYTEVADIASEMSLRDFPENDALHEQFIAGTLFNFKVNRRIFGSVFLFQSLTRWQKAMSNVDQRSPWPLREEERQDCLDRNVAAIRALLWKLADSPVTLIDPRGTDALEHARQIRRELKRLLRGGAVREDQVAQIGAYFRPAFQAAVDEPFERPGFVPLLTALRETDEEATARGEAVPDAKPAVLRRVVQAVKAGARGGAKQRRGERKAERREKREERKAERKTRRALHRGSASIADAGKRIANVLRRRRPAPEGPTEGPTEDDGDEHDS